MLHFGKAVATFFLLFLVTLNLYGEVRLERWKSHTNMTAVRSSAVDNQGRIWAATAGGFFVLNPEKTEYTKFTNIEGLLSLDLSVVRYDPSSERMFIGSNEGHLLVVDKDLNVRQLAEIAQSDYSDPGINDIYIDESFVYIACGFGMTILDLEDMTFPETVDKLGDFERYSAINSITIADGEIWVASAEGIAHAGLSAPLSYPDSWENADLPDGLYDATINLIQYFDGNIYAATDDSFIKMESGTFSIEKTLESDIITGMAIHGNELYFSTRFHIYNYEQDKILYTDWHVYYDDIIYEYGNLIVSTKTNGIGVISQDTTIFYKPNSPVTSNLESIVVTGNGTLWSATGEVGVGRGIMKLQDDTWTIYDRTNTPDIISDVYWIVSALSDNRVAAGSWGDGGIIMNEDATLVDHYDDSNSPLTVTTSTMVIVGESQEDRYGNIWTVNFGESSTGPVLVAMDTDNEFHSFYNCSSANNRYYRELMIDNNDTKWLYGSESGGILYINEEGNLDAGSSAKCGIVKGGGLGDNFVTSMAQDQNGVIWVGTAAGLGYIISSSAVLFDNDIIVRPTTVSLLKAEPINDIMVDALNNKWIATNSGVWILDPDGVELDFIDTDNSSLLSNNVLSLATNEDNGKIYFGTNAGLSEAYSLSLKPASSFDIECYPQPFNPGVDDELVIEGLGPDAEIKILTLSGHLIKTINTTGRKAVWDGRDNDGAYVATGVYMVVASSGSSDSDGVAKVAIVRK